MSAQALHRPQLYELPSRARTQPSGRDRRPRSCAYKQSVAYGGPLLFAYGLGVGLPILVLGAAAGNPARLRAIVEQPLPAASRRRE